MWTAFPPSDYYGPSAPLRRHRPATGVPSCVPSGMTGRDRRSGSHVHLGSVPQAWCPAMPQRLRHGYAAGIHHGLPFGDINRKQSSPRRSGDAHRNPAHIRQVGAGGSLLRGFQMLVPHVHRPVLLAGPAPSGSAGTSRRCRGCFPPALPYRRWDCPQLQPLRGSQGLHPAATGRWRCPFITARSQGASWRSISVGQTSSVALTFSRSTRHGNRSAGSPVMVLFGFGQGVGNQPAGIAQEVGGILAINRPSHEGNPNCIESRANSQDMARSGPEHSVLHGS